jgi:hypothetical protein
MVHKKEKEMSKKPFFWIDVGIVVFVLTAIAYVITCIYALTESG